MAAVVTILRETDRDVVIQITVAEILTNAVALSTASLNNVISSPILSLYKIYFTTGTNKASLLFHGSSTNKLIGNYSGTGKLDYYEDFKTKIINNASGTNGSILITTTTAEPTTLVFSLEKTSGFTKTNYYN